MLIVPISGKIGWKNPPAVTLALVLINCLVFFLFQRNDDQAWLAAEQFYLTSGLADIEVPLYLTYQSKRGTKKDGHEIDVAGDLHRTIKIHMEIEADADFLKRLRAEKVVVPQNPKYEKWRELRSSYEQLQRKRSTFAHGLQPAFPDISAFFTYMFLHGGIGHLAGNMFFLWILGSMLEMGCGRKFFAAIYFLSGIIAAGSFTLIYSASTAPLVGASGAIAGLMGAYTVLYGKTRVNVFYSLGVYFDTARVPAFVLLPVWLTNECYQLLFKTSHVAYIAHMGGIIAGAAMALTGDRLLGIARRESFVESPQERIDHLMNKALKHMGDLKMARARALFEKILEMSPETLEALTYLFNIHKLTGQSTAFHATSRQLLRRLLKTGADNQTVLACYKTYAALVHRTVLSIPLYLQIVGVMLAEGDIKSAERIVLAILKKRPATPGLPTSLIKLGYAFHKNGQRDKWERYCSFVRQKYPDSFFAALKSSKSVS